MGAVYLSKYKLRIMSLSVALVFSGAYVTGYANLSQQTIDQNKQSSQSTSVLELAKQAAEKEATEEKKEEEAKKQEAAKPEKEEKAKAEETKAEKEQRKLAAELSLHDEKLRAQYIDLRSEYQKLKWENDLIAERMANQKLKRDEELAASMRETDEKLSALLREKELLTEELAVEKLKSDVAQKEEIAEYETKLAKLSRDKTLLTEELDKMKLEQELTQRDEQVKHDDELATMRRESEMLKEKVSFMMSQLEEQDVEAKLKITKFDTELAVFNAETRREQYVDKRPVYLEDPLKDGTLIISDRRIALNGPITRGTADYVTERINFYNNKNTKYPIFLVIDASPGGSVLEGLRIIKSMEGSDAPVYVVVKSLAASMAATITAQAAKSYAYPNAYFVHHQISSIFFGKLNLSQKKEFYEKSKKLWDRVAAPIAKKMGITTEEYIDLMYKESLEGDWGEFATEAKKLKWVDHIVDGIKETSLIKNPDVKDEVVANPEAVEAKWPSKEVSLDDNGKPFVYLPRLYPHDYYYLHNPDGFYRVR